MPRITDLLHEWNQLGCDDMELTRRPIDLFFVSVLLDAGAGDHWRFVDPHTEQQYKRSEGIALASFHMFNSMLFTAAKQTGRPSVDGK